MLCNFSARLIMCCGGEGWLLFQPHGSDYRIFHSKHSMLFSSAEGKLAVLKSPARYIPGWSAISQQGVLFFHVTVFILQTNKRVGIFFFFTFFFFITLYYFLLLLNNTIRTIPLVEPPDFATKDIPASYS